MSGAQQFDSGGVIHRARAVLTFATAPRTRATTPKSARTDTPTPDPVSLHRAPPLRGSLPVIPRGVRRAGIVDQVLLRPLARGIVALRRAEPWPALFAALGLVTLLGAAGLGMRALSGVDGRTLATAEAPLFEASATESTLAFALPASRTETPAAIPLAETPRIHAPVAAGPRGHGRPSHRAVARSHAFAPGHAARLAPSAALARSAPPGAGIRR